MWGWSCTWGRDLNIMEELHDMIILFLRKTTWRWINRRRIKWGRIGRILHLSTCSNPFTLGELKLRWEAMKYKTLINSMTSLFAIFADIIISFGIKVHHLIERSVSRWRSPGIRTGACRTWYRIRGENKRIRMNFLLFSSLIRIEYAFSTEGTSTIIRMLLRTVE